VPPGAMGAHYSRAPPMSQGNNSTIARRDVLRVLTLGAGAAVAAAAPLTPAQAADDRKTENGRARYQPNSADVQNFYRVNRYPAK
jgi:hypothetical protein